MEPIKGHDNWHILNKQGVLSALQSDSEVGLSQTEVASRQLLFGKNSLPQSEVRSLWRLFFTQFKSPLIYLLLVAAGVAVWLGETKDAYVILLVVVGNAIIGCIQEGRAEQSLAALKKLAQIKARVVRNGQEFNVDAAELVPGDILKIAPGDAIPADARVLEAVFLATSEASLTGESVPIQKIALQTPLETQLADRNNMLYAGTYAVAGRGLAIVVAIGRNTEIGKIASLAQRASRPKTQLEQKIAQFGKTLVTASLVIFALVLLIGLWRGFEFSYILLLAISQMVSMVPEGLPVAMTIALAVGVQRMAKRRTIVRKLTAVETLGATSVICSDKTGTLTRNEMTVTQIYLPMEPLIEVTGAGYAPEGQLRQNQIAIDLQSSLALKDIMLISCLCNDAQLISPTTKELRWQIIGDPTEGALLTLAGKAGWDFRNIQSQFPRQAELPFDANFKMMATQHQIEGRTLVLLKGAPEAILQLCGFVKAPQGIEKMTSQTAEQVRFTAHQMAEQALRVLAFGYVENDFIEGQKAFAYFAQKVIFVGLIGQMDPPREEVFQAVKDCWSAGIRPVMVTGDHKVTGMAIARTVGISRSSDIAIDGIELDQMSDEELRLKLPVVSVFARVRPAQKLRIVENLQARGEVVAMTGDGVNDGPALVQADVGVAMGITGTEVAKESAKVIITDDNFATIVSAIAEGRLVYQNIKKLILFLFVTSIDEVIILFLALLYGFAPPLAAVQILWINLITEGALTINLIMEPAEGDELQRPPISIHQPLLDRALWSRVPLMVAASVVSTFGWFYFRTMQGVPEILVRSETFTVLAVCQWFNVFNCRSTTHSIFSFNIIKNTWLLGGLIVANLLHVAVIYWRPLGDFFHTVPIAIEQVLLIGVVASLVLWVEELRKLWIRRRSFRQAG